MKKKFQLPDTLIIAAVIMAVFAGLTWLVPAGEFERAANAAGRMVVVPGTYHEVAANPQGLWDLLLAPIKGFIGAVEVIAFVLLVGGSFGIINRSRAIDAALQGVVAMSQRKPHLRHAIIPVVMVFFSLAGATFGMSEEVLVFILITLPLSYALGYDTMVGVAIPFVGAGAGFAGAFANPFTIGVAQGIAGLPPFSGMGYRFVVWAVMTIVPIIFVMRYALQLEKDPTRAPLYKQDQKRQQAQETGEELRFTLRRVLVLLTFTGGIVLLIVGVGYWGWYIQEIAALFVALGVLSAFIAWLPLSEVHEGFLEGAKDMMTAVLVIAFSKGIVILAEDGKIIDTILFHISGVVDDLPKGISVQVMFFVQTFLNFFMPSGSGQAALTMPIMAPLSDLIGISRQTAVLAFQFGDGLSNLIIPTSGVTMGVLGIAKIPYQTWVKWFLPLFLLMVLTAMLLLLPPVLFFDYQ